jgi:hypothetical protein
VGNHYVLKVVLVPSHAGLTFAPKLASLCGICSQLSKRIRHPSPLMGEGGGEDGCHARDLYALALDPVPVLQTSPPAGDELTTLQMTVRQYLEDLYP